LHSYRSHRVARVPDLDIGVGEALVRLRAYAFANDRSVAEVAEEVVERRLRVDDHSPNAEPGP